LTHDHGGGLNSRVVLLMTQFYVAGRTLTRLLVFDGFIVILKTLMFTDITHPSLFVLDFFTVGGSDCGKVSHGGDTDDTDDPLALIQRFRSLYDTTVIGIRRDNIVVFLHQT
jgi:hypothetical protein